MKFTVVWLPKAIDGLADMWAKATDRNAVTVASDRLDAALSDHPLVVGESREGDFRLAFEPPLQVFFRVLPDDRRVDVFRVAPHRR